MISEDLTCYGGEKIFFKQAGAVVCWSLLEQPDGLSALLGFENIASKNNIEGCGDLPWIALEDSQILIAEGWAKILRGQNVEECAKLLTSEEQLPSKIRLLEFKRLNIIAIVSSIDF